jgi:NADPH2:quinone reductase
VPKPATDEVVVRIDAALLNPSDIILLLGPVDPVKIQAGGTPTHPTASASIPPERMLGLEATLDRALPAGNEGAGIVVDAGSDVQALVGRSVAARSPLGMYAQYRVVKASDCLVLPGGVSPREGASAFINPLTVVCTENFIRIDQGKESRNVSAPCFRSFASSWPFWPRHSSRGSGLKPKTRHSDIS